MEPQDMMTPTIKSFVNENPRRKIVIYWLLIKTEPQKSKYSDLIAKTVFPVLNSAFLIVSL